MPITVQFRDSKGIIWLGIGNGKGLARYDPRMCQFEEDTAIRTYPYRYPVGIVEDSQNNLWFLSDPTANLVKWNRSSATYEVIRIPGIQGDLYGATGNLVLDQSTGNLWYDIISLGLVRYNIFSGNAEIFGADDGFTGGVITDITVDKRGLIWVSSSNGISSFDPRKRKFTNYDKTDGLAANEYLAIYYDQASDILYAGARNLLTWFSPSALKETRRPLEVYFTGLVVNNKPMLIPENHKIYLKPTQNNLIVSYTGVNLSNGEANSYQYKLTPGQGEWIDMATEKQLNLAGLQPGKYHLQVRGARKNGPYHEAAVPLYIHIQTPITSTFWFYFLLLTVVTVAIYSWQRYRISQLRKLSEMRLHISQDLHDDIGSRVTNIGLMSDMAKATATKDSEYLNYIKNESIHIAQRMKGNHLEYQTRK